MGLFDKKYCDICGKKIGLLGNRKLADGNMCKDCAKQLSPFLTGRKHFTVEDMKQHLAYREANKEKVAAFNPTRTIGGRMTIYFDEDKHQWIATRDRKWRDENPDVIDFSQVTGCTLDIDENKRELYRTTNDGKQLRYNPPRHEYSYDFNMMIYVNSPWFDQIQFKVNDEEIRQRGGAAYREAQAAADEIKTTLTQVRDDERESTQAANAPKVAVVCPHCHATTLPDANNCCEYCGGALDMTQ